MSISITRAVTLKPTSLPVKSLEGPGSFREEVAIFWLALPTFWRCGFHLVSKTVVPAAHFDHELRIAILLLDVSRVSIDPILTGIFILGVLAMEWFIHDFKREPLRSGSRTVIVDNIGEFTVNNYEFTVYYNGV